MPFHVPPHLDAQDWLKGHSQENKLKMLFLCPYISEKKISLLSTLRP